MRIWKAALASALLWAIPAAAQEETQTRTYTIRHALFGTIGTMSDEITQDGPLTKVVARAEVAVTILGLRLHHLELEWNEVWQGETLMEYRASTTRNGSTESVSGHHENGKFVIRAGERGFTAPADVHPTHPWSLRFVRTAHLMSPESGAVFAASVADKGDETLVVGGIKRRVRHYVVTLDTVNQVYFDESGTLLLAEFRDITGRVRFVLQSPNKTTVASAQ